MHVRRGLAGAAVLAALLAVPVSSVSAATPSAHGYWWRLQTGTGPALPKPPTVPPGGMWVSSNASGQQALSAVRYRAPSGVEIRRLVLRVADSSGQGAVVLACPAGAGWKPAEAGAWSARPTTSCDVAFVNGVRSPDGALWSFDVRGLARSGTLDVVILPPPDARSVFSISFAAPDSSSIVTQRLPGSPTPSTTSSAEESPHAGRVTPPTRVLASETTPPAGSQLSSLPPLVTTSPSATAPSGLQAAPRIEPAYPRRGTVIGIAAALAVMALLGLSGRVVMQRRSRA
jgi:hypothetical protein